MILWHGLAGVTIFETLRGVSNIVQLHRSQPLGVVLDAAAATFQSINMGAVHQHSRNTSGIHSIKLFLFQGLR